MNVILEALVKQVKLSYVPHLTQWLDTTMMSIAQYKFIIPIVSVVVVLSLLTLHPRFPQRVYKEDHERVEQQEKDHEEVEQQVEEEQCTPQNNIMFMKTHKTASSTVQKILLSYAEKKNLEVALPPGRGFRFPYDNGMPFRQEFVRQTAKQQPVNIMCHHMVFNYAEVSKVMPSDSIYLTIIREPSSHFESLFDYTYSRCAQFRSVPNYPNGVENWFKNPESHFKGKESGSYWWYGKNPMLFDLGFDNLINDDVYIKGVIQTLEEQFQLVMIAEYFDESILLLKKLLCWKMEDVLSLRTNIRGKTSTMSSELKTKIRKWNKAESMVYDHFNNTLWQKIEEYGIERMRLDVEELRNKNKRIKSECVEGEAVDNKLITDKRIKLYQPRGVTVMAYNLQKDKMYNSTCVGMVISERAMTYKFRLKYEHRIKQMN